METVIGLTISIILNVVLLVLLLRIKEEKKRAVITEEGIRMMVDAGGDNGSIDITEKEMINNIFELGNTSVGEIATHRRDIVAIPFDASFIEIMKVISEEKYSRIVVYNDNIDNIIGLLHVKDVVKFFLSDELDKSKLNLMEILKKPFFVPFSKKTDELFQEMQREKVHMAIVIDEYGGTAGLVTMEDVIEEIVGNIFDEYDLEEEEEISIVDENTYRINGTTNLADVADLLQITFEDEEDYDTLGGYLIGRLGRIPEEQEKPEIVVDNWLFRIERIEEKRIEKVLALGL
ncbi:hemolysin family protein [Anaerotignum sp. MB30-C6]|uniref:hemolysin family protein n=1 Tax=Anaerotignum sp. MB30-C6 TaxID=3070814 RepID=UPI0027DCDB5E|nr:hemolysin family protein [Anaerotignum sp. MB30-C6]WMI82260.1 hemolysin family protein [Anaerotignum sp. MB30-C6]